MAMRAPENPKYAGLIRGLATAIVVGAMIGQGVFLVAGDMARELGSESRVLLAWIIGGIVRSSERSASRSLEQPCRRRAGHTLT